MDQLQNLSLDLIDSPKLAMRAELDDEEMVELMASMKEFGLLEPIVVRKIEDRFEIIAGDRRTRAARLLGWPHIEAKIMVANEEEVLVLRLTENLQRKDIDPVDEACYIGEIMLKHKKTAEEMSTLLRRTQDWIDTRIEVFEMPDYIQVHLKQKKYPLGAALWINRIENESTKRYYANWAAVNGCTVAFAHRWYVTLKEVHFVLPDEKDIVVEAGTPQEQVRKTITCGRCGGPCFLDEADSVFIHKVCPTKQPNEKG